MEKKEDIGILTIQEILDLYTENLNKEMTYEDLKMIIKSIDKHIYLMMPYFRDKSSVIEDIIIGKELRQLMQIGDALKFHLEYQSQIHRDKEGYNYFYTLCYLENHLVPILNTKIYKNEEINELKEIFNKVDENNKSELYKSTLAKINKADDLLTLCIYEHDVQFISIEKYERLKKKHFNINDYYGGFVETFIEIQSELENSSSYTKDEIIELRTNFGNVINLYKEYYQNLNVIEFDNIDKLESKER